MLTNLAKKAIALGHIMSKGGVSTGYAFKALDGTQYTLYLTSSTSGANSYDAFGNDIGVNMITKGASNSRGVIFGNGTAEPTGDDYKLSGDVLTGLSFTHTINQEFNENSVTNTVTYTITNGNDNSVTISEVGLVCQFYRASTSNALALADHTLLDKPVVIEAGAVGQVVYSITCNF